MFSANMVRQYSFLNKLMTELEADSTQVCFICPFLVTVTFEYSFSSGSPALAFHAEVLRGSSRVPAPRGMTAKIIEPNAEESSRF